MKCVCDINKCAGCSACKNICPKECISFVRNSDGFSIPFIDESKCINCELCKSVCPIINPVIDDKREPITIAAYSKDEDSRRLSSSGGVFALLGNYIISSGGVVVGAAFDENMHLMHFICNKKADLVKLQGSKYIQSDLGDTFSTIKKMLEDNRLVLFTGTPCQIAGLRLFLKKDYQTLYTQDLLCHGVPSPLVWEKYIEMMENEENSKIVSADFRCKDSGWNSYSIKIIFDSGTIKRELAKNNKYFLSYMMGMCHRKSCEKCEFKHVHRVSDITLGDFWGIDDVLKEFNDKKGTSIVMIHSKKGEKLFNNVKNSLVFKKIRFEQGIIKNDSMIRSSKSSPLRNNFLKQISNLGFKKAFNKNCSNSITCKIKRKIAGLFDGAIKK